MSRAREYAKWFYSKKGAQPFFYSRPLWAQSAVVAGNAVINLRQSKNCKAILLYDLWYTNAGGAAVITGMNGEVILSSTNVGPTDRIIDLQYFYPNTQILRLQSTNGVNVIINVSFQCVFEENYRDK